MNRAPFAGFHWLPILFVTGAVAAWWLFHWPALVTLHRRWWTFGELYEIGYPLLAIGIYWAFLQRPLLRRAAISPSVIGGVLFLLALLTAGAARLAQLLVIQQLMVPVSLWCGLFALCGWPVARLLLMPCVLLLGGVPMWDFLIDPLRLLTVQAAQFLLSLLRIPALVDGYDIALPRGVMQVADACSGLNLLLAALVLSTLQAALGLRSPVRRVLLVAIGAAIGIVDNWLRVFVLIAIAYYSDMRSSLVHDHIGFGWGLFAASLVPFFLIARALERGEQRAGTASATSAAVASGSFNRRGVALAAACLALAALGVTGWVRHLERDTASAVAEFAPPPGAVAVPEGWLPRYAGYDLAQTWRLPAAQRNYDLTVLLYREQRQGKKLVYYSNRIADAHEIRYATQTTLTSGQVVNLTVLHGGRRGAAAPRAVWWYWRIDGEPTVSALSAKWLQFRATLRGDSSAALVAFSVTCRDVDCAGEVREAGGALLPQLHASLRALPAD